MNLGANYPATLIERINSETFIGENLTESTRGTYAEKFEAIKNNIRALGFECTPDNVITYFKNQISSEKYSHSTARLIKAAILFWLADEGSRLLSSDYDISSHENAYIELRSLKFNKKSTSNKTSSKKEKAFSEHYLKTLEKYCNKNLYRSKNAIPLLSFVKANLILGLRPIEWFNCRLFYYLQKNNDDSFKINIENKFLKPCLALAVDNAKHDHNRGNGESRFILLDKLTPKELAFILDFKERISRFMSENSEFNLHELNSNYFSPLQRHLKSIWEQYFKSTGDPVPEKLPTIYSTRHQAVANAKKTGFSRAEIAALFGHSSTYTAKIYYGKIYSGWGKTKCYPAPESVAAVRIPNAENQFIDLANALLNPTQNSLPE